MNAPKFARKNRQLRAAAGQTNILIVVILALFFFAFLGFAIDFANLWFHRQMAQGAADAACQAGAMDLLVDYGNGASAQGGFTPGMAFDCNDHPAYAPCQYAALNGYTGAGLTAGTPGAKVTATFPGGAPPSITNLAPNPYIQIDLVDRTKTYFSNLVTGNNTQDVHASAMCGLTLAKAPIPMIVLNPTCKHSFQLAGSSKLKIVGGPARSVEVDSADQSCAAAGGNASGGCSGGTVDLSLGGPDFSGSNFGVFGAPTSPSFTFLGGTTGSYSSPGSPIADPFSRVAAPTNPGGTGMTGPTVSAKSTGCSGTPAPAGCYHDAKGCPDNKGCDEYTPGRYTQPIVVKGVTALFDPGVYYIKPTSYPSSSTGGGYCGTAGSSGGQANCPTGGSGQCRTDLVVDSGGGVRISNATGDGSRGVMFYLSGPGGTTGFGSAVFTSNAGGVNACPVSGNARCVDSVAKTKLSCDGVSDPDPGGKLGIPANLSGNLLMGQCTTNGTYFGAGSSDTINTSSTGIRGLLFFQDRSNNDNMGQMNFQGGGGLAFAGNIYVHNCPNSPTCSASDYQAFLDLQGGSTPNTYLLGEIVTDELVETGGNTVAMQLNPNKVYPVIKVELLK